MTAPTPTARTEPTVALLENGYQSLITFATDSDVALFEKSTTPPAIDGGEAIDITTMFNLVAKTKAPQALYDLSDGQMTCGYNPAVYDGIIALVNLIAGQTITQHFPDGSSLAYFGYLKSFAPAALTNGTFPEATVTIVATNRDPSDTSGTGEEAPVYTAPTP